ncbi:MAG: heavy-metal-associated domain-containing protein [Caloramator sp.]|nr:heavy-metal-associated domain-containing protein [Caloramator sp.]
MRKKLNIEGMTCNHCVMHVKNALLEAGVNVLEVNLNGKYALVEGENLDDAKMKEAIADAGYDVVSIENI